MINPGLLQNEVAKHKTRESLEASLQVMVANNDVLEYKEEDGLLLVTINGQTQPVKLQVPQFEPTAHVQEPEPSKSNTEVQSQMKGQMVLDGVLYNYGSHVRSILNFALARMKPQFSAEQEAIRLTGEWVADMAAKRPS